MTPKLSIVSSKKKYSNERITNIFNKFSSDNLPAGERRTNGDADCIRKWKDILKIIVLSSGY